MRQLYIFSKLYCPWSGRVSLASFLGMDLCSSFQSTIPNIRSPLRRLLPNLLLWFLIKIDLPWSCVLCWCQRLFSKLCLFYVALLECRVQLVVDWVMPLKFVMIFDNMSFNEGSGTSEDSVCDFFWMCELNFRPISRINGRRLYKIWC